MRLNKNTIIVNIVHELLYLPKSYIAYTIKQEYYKSILSLVRYRFPILPLEGPSKNYESSSKEPA